MAPTPMTPITITITIRMITPAIVTFPTRGDQIVGTDGMQTTDDGYPIASQPQEHFEEQQSPFFDMIDKSSRNDSPNSLTGFLGVASAVRPPFFAKPQIGLAFQIHFEGSFRIRKSALVLPDGRDAEVIEPCSITHTRTCSASCKYSSDTG